MQTNTPAIEASPSWLPNTRTAEEYEAAAADAVFEAQFPPPIPSGRAPKEEQAYILAAILKPNAPVYLMTSKEVCLMLGLDDNALPIMRMQGKGPKYHVMGNRMIRYRSDDVVAWLKSIERTSTSDTGQQ